MLVLLRIVTRTVEISRGIVARVFENLKNYRNVKNRSDAPPPDARNNHYS